MKRQPVRVKTPLKEDLLFNRMEAYEELGRLFQYQLDLLSPKEDLSMEDLLGKDLTVEFDLPNDKTRYFHGYVTEFSQTGRQGDYATYAVIVHPWLWFLTRSADCKIYQEMTVPDIIKDIFREEGFSDFKDSLTEDYRTWEYCVQYRETHFNFVSRLMEQEGIYYYFEHEDGKDTLVLSDAYSAHSALPHYAKIPYYPPTQTARDEHIFDWHLSKSVRTGACAIGAFHFIKPKANLGVTTSIPHSHDKDSYEIFDYPGEYYERGEGDRYVGVRMEELACEFERVAGETDARGVFPGGLFDLTEFPRKDQNREYLVIAARHSLSLGGYESGSGEGLKYNCSFEAMNSRDPFRSARTTPKPVVQGPQTAIVVGKGGEEIWTDDYGRVKVQFHWDRYGQDDENSSCWVRVAQVWAGGQWGGMTIPRMGQEVIIDFIEGDPDRPIVTGRVYNADNMPPYGLPGDKTKSTLKSHSSKGGAADNFNEIRFEDLKDSEEIYIHAEKDHNTVIENNQTVRIGFDKQDAGDRSISVNNDELQGVGRDRIQEFGRDKTESIGRNKAISVAAEHNEKIDGSMSVMVGSNLTESVGVNYSETVGAAMELTVGGVCAITVGAAMTEQVGAAKSESIGGSKSENIGSTKSTDIGASLNESIGKDRTIKVDKDDTQTIGGKQSVSVKKEQVINAQKIQLVAKDEVNLKTGKAEIVMKKNGDVTIKGKKIQIKGSGDVIIKGSKIKEN